MRPPEPSLALLARRSLRARARPRRLRRRRRQLEQRQRRRRRPRRRPTTRRRSRRTPTTPRRTLTIGSKNFTEQQVLGEIYAQALAAAGYKVKKRAQPRRRADRAQGAEGRRHRRLPGVHRHGAAVVLQGHRTTDLPKDPRQAYDQAKAKLRQAGHHRVPAHAVHVLQRGRGDEGDGGQVGLKNISDLDGKVAASSRSTARPECRQRLDCLLGLEKVYGLKFKKFVPVDIAPAPRGADERPGRRVDRVHDRPADQARQARSCSRTTRACSRPTTRRCSLKTTAVDKAGPDLAEDDRRWSTRA